MLAGQRLERELTEFEQHNLELRLATDEAAALTALMGLDADELEAWLASFP
ncbi:MAG: hypothetical protein AAFX99_04045 [Myxococcota bacterium]